MDHLISSIEGCAPEKRKQMIANLRANRAITEQAAVGMYSDGNRSILLAAINRINNPSNAFAVIPLLLFQQAVCNTPSFTPYFYQEAVQVLSEVDTTHAVFNTSESKNFVI